MFYSQFILAKKGPLGTIWIAAHLERKLRKNQVADTDIGVSVDSILFPDVPIALRLSSHLLLGVVRIYNRKVNYLFDDCSEALLKVKQAFRSTAVDLPPEESKAPYHSITLPETFDLDDFELPDNEIFHGNFVDHHISSREQITLQDTLDGVTYSTSKFGLDERFGDGDASGLDLDEELFLGKVDAAGLTNERSDPQSSVWLMTPLKQDENPEIRTGDSGTRDDDADLMEYAQAPGTPGLVEEPNLSNGKEVSACDDHMELENPLGELTVIENAKNNVYGDKQEADWSSQNSKSCDAVTTVEKCGHQSGSLDVDSSKPQEETLVEENSKQVQTEAISGSNSPSKPVGQDKSVNSSSELADKIIGASQVPCTDDVQNGDADVMNSTLPVDESDHHQGPFNTSFEKESREVSGDCHQDESFLENRETQVSDEMGDPSSSNIDVHEKVASSESPFVRPRNSRMEQPDFISECAMSADAAVQSDVTDLATSGREEMVMIGKARSEADYPEEVSKEDHFQEHALQEGVDATSDKPSDQVRNATPHDDILVDNLHGSAEANLSAPEKLLSVPEDVDQDQQNNMFGGISPVDYAGLDASDAGSKVISSKKRSFTESTLTEQSLNSVESSRLVRFKRTIESMPDDDDLLSSILVGRSSVLKVKPTPRPSEVASTKRTSSAQRTPKRKVLMDDPMVLHGDMIRQQLTNSEDIRRVRKKAPCSQSEISLIQKQYLEDESFLEPLFTGLSIELVSLHTRIWNLSSIQVCNNEPKDSSLENVADLWLPSENAPPENDKDASPETTAAPISSPVNVNDDDSLTTATEPPSESLNAENCEILDIDRDKGSEKHNVAGQNGVRINDELSSYIDGEMAKTGESPLPTDNGMNEVHEMNVEINTCDEQSKLNGDMDADVSNREPLLGVSGLETSDKNDDEEKNASCADLDAENRLATEDELIARDGDVNSGFETEPLVRDDVSLEVAQESVTVEKLSNSKQGELEFDKQNEIHSAIVGENVEYSSYAAEQDYGFIENGRSPEQPEAHHHYSMDVDNFDMHDQEEWKYSAAGNDTDFLNVDDDELNEMPDDHDAHDEEEARFIENTGWSSRTRAVSKYLQTLFVNEAEQGRKALPLEKLLVGKSRKEASRMFFETLVLKTRDYIHVEQQNPFDVIAMKPRTRLMKTGF